MQSKILQSQWIWTLQRCHGNQRVEAESPSTTQCHLCCLFYFMKLFFTILPMYQLIVNDPDSLCSPQHDPMFVLYKWKMEIHLFICLYQKKILELLFREMLKYFNLLLRTPSPPRKNSEIPHKTSATVRFDLELCLHGGTNLQSRCLTRHTPDNTGCYDESCGISSKHKQVYRLRQ